MWTKRQRGVTLIELIVAMVIIGVAVGGMMAAFTATSKGSVDPVVSKQMVAVAESMMEEILLKPYSGTNGATRADFTNVMNYNGYATSGVVDASGNAITELAGYNLAVAVTAVSLTNVPTPDAYRIQVTVSHGADKFELQGWRTKP